MRCDEVASRLVEYLDGVADPQGERQVREHVRRCPACARLIEEHASAWELLDLLAPAQPTERSREGLLAIPARERRARMRRLSGGLAALAAAAALVAVLGLAGLFSRSSSSPAPVADEELIAHLDLVEDLDFLVSHGLEIDASRELALLEFLEPQGEAQEAK
jgi:predicted anti-sigma-YlaC factor YlaD